jgi:hypothetical protein
MRLCILSLLLLLPACPTQQGTSGRQPARNLRQPALSVTLLRTDLGLGDGELVRDADAALRALADDAAIHYVPVGDLPAALQVEGGTGDVGLPDIEAAGGARAIGVMSLEEAGALARQLESADVLILSGPLAYAAAQPQLSSGKVKYEQIILLDGEGPAPESGYPDNLAIIQYDVREAAYLLGVAASVSSRSQAFVAFTSDQDPNADELLVAVENGIHNRMRGGNVYHERLSPDAAGIVAPEDFRGKLLPLIEGLQTNHYIVVAGRATPSIMYALSSAPTSGYLLGGYGDFRQVRPARLVCCIVKRPGRVLAEWLEGATTPAELVVAVRGSADRRYGLGEGAVEVTDLRAYAKFNQDAEDIADAVEQVRREILEGELEVSK